MARLIQKIRKARIDERICRNQFKTKDIYFSRKTLAALLHRSFPTINNAFGNDALAEAEAYTRMTPIQRFFPPHARQRILGKRIIERRYRNVRFIRRNTDQQHMRCQFCLRQHMNFIYAVDVLRRNGQFTQLLIGIQCGSKILSVQAGRRIDLFDHQNWRRPQARNPRQ